MYMYIYVYIYALNICIIFVGFEKLLNNYRLMSMKLCNPEFHACSIFGHSRSYITLSQILHTNIFIEYSVAVILNTG